MSVPPEHLLLPSSPLLISRVDATTTSAPMVLVGISAVTMIDNTKTPPGSTLGTRRDAFGHKRDRKGVRDRITMTSFGGLTSTSRANLTVIVEA